MPLLSTLVLTSALACGHGGEPAECVAPVEAPAPSPEWRARERRLQIQLGVSAGVMGVGLVMIAGGLIADFTPCKNPDPTFGCGEFPIGFLVFAPVGAVITLAAAIPTGIYGARLSKHRRGRAKQAFRFAPAPGGFQLRF